jgi:hypothetical protein
MWTPHGVNRRHWYGGLVDVDGCFSACDLVLVRFLERLSMLDGCDLSSLRHRC